MPTPKRKYLTFTNSYHGTEVRTTMEPGKRYHNDRVLKVLRELCGDRQCPCYRTADGRYQFRGQIVVDTEGMRNIKKPYASQIAKNLAWLTGGGDAPVPFVMPAKYKKYLKRINKP